MRHLLGLVLIGGTLIGLLSAYKAWADKTAGEKRRQYLAQRIEEGKEVVSAIYIFKQHNGLWPSKLDELLPDFLATEKLKDWEFSWHPDDWWLLTDVPGRLQGLAVSFDYRSSTEKGWIITDGVSRDRTGIAQPMPLSIKLTAEEVDRNRSRLMMRRIKAAPRTIVHHQGLICWHLRRKELDEARAACQFCAKELPGHWWPRLTLAVIDAEMGKAAVGESMLRQWVEQEPGFNRFFFLSHFYVKSDRLDKAFEALADASKHQFRSLMDPGSEDGSASGFSPCNLPWIAATFALEKKQYDVAITVCNRWEDYRRGDVSADQSYLLIRGACYLAKGRFEQAEHDIGLVPAGINATWAQNLTSLKKAIAERDKSYLYKPRDKAPSFDLMIQYE